MTWMLFGLLDEIVPAGSKLGEIQPFEMVLLMYYLCIKTAFINATIEKIEYDRASFAGCCRGYCGRPRYPVQAQLAAVALLYLLLPE